MFKDTAMLGTTTMPNVMLNMGNNSIGATASLNVSRRLVSAC
jgi:hypothetical protein